MSAWKLMFPTGFQALAQLLGYFGIIDQSRIIDHSLAHLTHPIETEK